MIRKSYLREEITKFCFYIFAFGHFPRNSVKRVLLAPENAHLGLLNLSDMLEHYILENNSDEEIERASRRHLQHDKFFFNNESMTTVSELPTRRRLKKCTLLKEKNRRRTTTKRHHIASYATNPITTIASAGISLPMLVRTIPVTSVEAPIIEQPYTINVIRGHMVLESNVPPAMV